MIPYPTDQRRRRASATAAIGLLFLGLLAQAGTAHGATPALTLTYLGLVHKLPAPSAVLTPPIPDDALQGAELGIADDNTTGRFLNQAFTLAHILSPDPAALLKDFDAAIKSGQRLFVVDAPATLLLKMADSSGAENALILDATSQDDALRGADCRHNLLHTLPDRAMLTDALMQYLVSKNWRRIMLLVGKTPEDALYATAIRHSAAKFQIRIVADRPWTFNAAAQQADTGHYEVNAEVNDVTQGPNYDVLAVADEEGNFGNQVAYRTARPRPEAGTQGLVAQAWSPVMDEYASTELQLRFRHQAGRDMNNQAYGAWLATSALGESATRTGSLDPTKIIAYIRGPQFELSGYKGPPFSFRPWDGQLRQPVLLADTMSLVSVAPLPGFLHQTNTLDTLGTDQPETTCHMPSP